MQTTLFPTNDFETADALVGADRASGGPDLTQLDAQWRYLQEQYAGFLNNIRCIPGARGPDGQPIFDQERLLLDVHQQAGAQQRSLFCSLLRTAVV